MALTKIDLEKIGKVVDKRVGGSEKTITTKLEKKIDSAVDELAGMTKKGFDEVYQRLDNLDKAQGNHKKHFSLIEQGLEDIKLRQDNAAYRFELNALDRRVTKLEKD